MYPLAIKYGKEGSGRIHHVWGGGGLGDVINVLIVFILHDLRSDSLLCFAAHTACYVGYVLSISCLLTLGQ